MALVKLITHIQTHMPMLGSAKVEALLPYITSAEHKYLRDGVLGKTLYDALHTAYQADITLAGNTAWRPLLLHCQNAMVHLGFYDALPIVNVLFSSGGLQVNSSPTTGQVAASEYRSRAAQQAVQTQGFNALDQLIGWLWDNHGAVPTWDTSEFYRQHGRGLIRRVPDFELGGVRIGSSGWLLHMILPAVRRAEDQVRDLLCKTAYDEIITLMVAGTALSPAQQTIVDVARQAVANIAIAESIVPLHLHVGPDGVSQFEASNSVGGGAGGQQPSNAESKNALIESYQAIGARMLKKVETEARRLAALGSLATYAASTCYTNGESAPMQGNPDGTTFAMF